MSQSLFDRFHHLPVDQKRTVHEILCKRALTAWQRFSEELGRIHYVESVCGTQQMVDPTLPHDAFRAVSNGREISEIERRYQEPLAAMQDDDLVFPAEIEFAYYALYNLFKKYALREEVDDWVIVNQALASEGDAAMSHANLEAAIATATSQ